MNITIIGGNDGSHVLAQLLLEDHSVNKIYHHGANWPADATERYVPLYIDEVNNSSSAKDQVINFLNIPDVDLIIPNALQYIIWPKFYDKIKSRNIPILAPSPEIGMLEWSKILGKALLTELKIPTPDYKIYNRHDLLENFFNIERPFVFKYDRDDRCGLQTVIVTDENCQEEYTQLKENGNKRLFETQNSTLGPLNETNFVVEKFLKSSREYSYHVICNSVNWQYLGSSRDYKNRFDGDIGFNTVGIGAYAPLDVNPIVHTYVDKILSHLKAKGKEWIGFMYLGIMEDVNGVPYVLEINTRLGNPELQVLLPLIENNLKDLFYSAATNNIIEPVRFKNKSAVAVRLIHKSYHQVKPYEGLINPTFDDAPEIYIGIPASRQLFNASVVAVDDTVELASNRVYKYLEGIEMHDFTYRKDIGYLK